MKKVFHSAISKAGTCVLAATLVLGGCPIGAHAYDTNFQVESTAAKSAAATPDPTWNATNVTAPESVGFTNANAAKTLKTIQNKDFAEFEKDPSKLPWMDKLLVNKGIIPDDDTNAVNTLFSRGSALYMRTQEAEKLGFVGQPYYADTLNQSALINVDFGSASITEDSERRLNYPSHESQTFTGSNLTVVQKKFITEGNTAVALYAITNTSNSPVTFTMTVSSPFAKESRGDELIGTKVAAPMMVNTTQSGSVSAMSYVDVHLAGRGLSPDNDKLTKEITVPAGKAVQQNVVMGWIAKELPQSKVDYTAYKAYSNADAFKNQVETYNSWLADNIPYIDIADKNVKKVIYYRWWCNRFNILDAEVPGNDWQFPMNMEGVLGYNNGITVSVPWAMQDLKWLRDPTYVYGTWLAQGEYSGDDNYKNNPGRPGTWTWDMMQNTSQVGLEAYKIHGGGSKILKKFADYAKGDVLGSLTRFGGTGDFANLICYNHGPITGNDGDCVGMHYQSSKGNNYARIDGSSTVYANAVAAAKMYTELGDSANAKLMNDKAEAIRNAMLKEFWYEGSDFDGDKEKDTDGEGSFLHRQVATNAYVPYRDNNMFAFSFGVAPTALEKTAYPDYAKYTTQLKDYGDPAFYPLFPFYTADQNSITKRVNDLKKGDTDKTCCDHFAWCNFGNYINLLRSSMRYYPVSNINADTYKKLFEYGAWLHTVEPGNTDHLDANEFFWSSDFAMDATANSKPTGNLVRSWIHHDTLGMMDYSVIEDMAGLQPRLDNKIELWPLNVNDDHFVVDNVRYHNKDLTIVWQKSAGTYEGVPQGFSLYVDGKLVMNNNEMSHVIYNPETGTVEKPTDDVPGAVGNNQNTVVNTQALPDSSISAASKTSLASNSKTVDLFNKAGIDLSHDTENLALSATVTSSYSGAKIERVKDDSTVTGGGSTFLDNSKKVAHTALFKGTPNASDTIDFDFGSGKAVDTVKLYFYNDRMTNGYGTPASFDISYLDSDGSFKPVADQIRQPAMIASNYNNVEFPQVTTSKIRVTLHHSTNVSTGVKEIQIYDNHLGITHSNNEAPEVSLPDALRVEQNSVLQVTPDVSDSTLPNGALTYQWTVAVTPDNGNCTITNASASTLKASFDTVGIYQLKLTVSDGDKETVVPFNVTVFIPTSELTDLMAPYLEQKTAGGLSLIRNQNDFTSASWNKLQTEIAAAQKLLDEKDFTKSEIVQQTQNLQKAINNLKYVNIGLLATPTASYTAGWEHLPAVNDGFVPTANTGAENDTSNQKLQWGNWGSGSSTQSLTYAWNQEYKISGSSVFFYDDGGGTMVPSKYTISYYDKSNKKADQDGFVTIVTKDLSTDKDRTTALGKFVSDSFPAVSTSKLRITLSNRDDAYNGIKEWRVLTQEPVAAEKRIQSATPVSVETYVNQMPSLPATVPVTYTDGTSGTAQVSWSAVAKDKLSIATSFTLTGTISGTDQSASCTIVVKYDKRELDSLLAKLNAYQKSAASYQPLTADEKATVQNALTKGSQVSTNTSATDGDIQGAVLTLKTALALYKPVASAPAPSVPSSDTVSSDSVPRISTVSVNTNPEAKLAVSKAISGTDHSEIAMINSNTDKCIVQAVQLSKQKIYLYRLRAGTLELASAKLFSIDQNGQLPLSKADVSAISRQLQKGTCFVLIPATEHPPVSSITGTVKVAQGNTAVFDLTGGNATSYTAGNGTVMHTLVFGNGKLGAYASGKIGKKTGAYVNGVKLFEIETIKAPYHSDTTVDMTLKSGQTYWFKIIADDPAQTVSYTAGNGQVGATRSKGKQADGSYLFGITATGKQGERTGLYIHINNQTYCVFHLTIS
ncbi:Ig-like domain-containing protein [Caproicibacterium argilliputei]|uniref:Ig-like domain-containing protein n=1 Tax=Caproicibacterium argilliputei TaxID=3030016 RepID=A0AA97DBN8_9FIRM|nr:Ig-like domain-containing protein [Caproicibacterium argilliputei]WOC32797.1 Ig-like domain-containing protein [Caproicibacterium argilliputei]